MPPISSLVTSTHPSLMHFHHSPATNLVTVTNGFHVAKRMLQGCSECWTQLIISSSVKHSPLLAWITSPSLVSFLPHWSLLSLPHWNLTCYVTSNVGELRVLVFNPCFSVYSSHKKSHLCLWLWIPSSCCWFSNIYLQPWPLSWAPDIYSQFPMQWLHSTWIFHKDIKLLICASESLITPCHHYVHHTSCPPGSSFQ